MPDSPTDLEAQVGRLAGRLERIERRLSALEARLGEPAGPDEAAGEAAGALTPPAVEAVLQPALVPLVGRTLMVLAGAFLLRAITEQGLLHPAAGAALGLAYAVAWLIVAERAAKNDRCTSAGFHGLAASVIAFPLIWESTVNLGFLRPAWSVVALALFVALALGVAFLRGLYVLGWLATLGCAGTAIALAAGTKLVIPFSALILLLGLATLWIGWLRGWEGIAWTTAAMVDGTIVLLTLMILIGEESRVREVLQPGPLIGLQLMLVVVYCGSFIARTLSRGAEVTPGQMVQGFAALACGLGGAIAVTRVSEVTGVVVGGTSLVLAAGCYAATFAFIDRHAGRRLNFVFYSTLALLFTLLGLDAALRGAALVAALALAAVGTAWLGAYRSRATLSLHGAVYATAAAGLSGLLVGAVDVLFGAGGRTAVVVAPPALIALAAAAVCSWFQVATHGRTWGSFSNAPKLALLTVTALGLGGVVVALGRSLLWGDSDPVPDLAAFAVLRTGVLSVAAVLLAWAGSWRRIAEAAWLVYPVLILAAAKLLLQDMRAGRPSTLFLSFALYGGALIVAPWIARRTRKAEPT